MAIFFSCCPWQISQNVRVAPAPVLANHRNNNSGGENNIATRSKTDVEMLKNNQKSSTQSTQARKEKVQLISLAEESSSVNAAEINLPMTGHCFKRKTFHKPTYCHHCSDLLWGLTNQGLQCSVCGYVTHERCQAQVVTACNVKASSLVQIPRLHTFVDLASEKTRRFCNVCRKKMDDQGSFKCDVCPYYVHGACKKLIVNNCKLTATATSNTKNLKVKQQHHWTEGHLPVNSKCCACAKACSSTDCLTGLRCSWCLKTVHSYCVCSLPLSCEFGVLRGLVLPPFVVKDFNPNTWASQAKLINDDDKESLDEPVYNGGGDGFILRIHEGPVENPHTWRNFMINKATTTADVLQDAYKKFHIKEDKTKYYLTRVNSSNVERKLEESDVLWTKLDTSDSTLKQVFLRHVKLDTKSLKIVLYAGAINSSKASVKLKINIMAEARDIIKTAMEEFQLEEQDPSKFCITQMKVTHNKVKETYISDDHSLYEVLVEKRKQTVAELHSTRFYLQTKEKPDSEVSLFVGNLPTNLSHYQYKYLLGDVIGKWNEELMSIEAVFPLQGALVIHFKSVECFLKNVASFKTAQIEGKSLSLRLLPEIKVDLLPAGSSPLIVFVNSKSGGGQGSKLMTTFKRLLNPYQIADLLDGGPLPALYVFRNLKRFRILICGGDGTFGWVLSSLEEIRYHVLKCTHPPSALLPLGTGNDLARILNWGSGYHGESVIDILTSISYAPEVMLDRWNIVFDRSQIKPPPEECQQEENDVKCDPIQMFAMSNYLGVGIDAHICLEFHLSREENPEKFNNRIHNKGVYLKASLKNLSKSSMSNLQERLDLEVDGETIPLPSIEGIAITNISSWGAGADPWGKDRDEKFAQPSYSDGMLEVIGFTGVYHMGKIQGGLSTGIRIAQGAQINMSLKEALPVQVDGEPWMQPPCRVMIRPCLQQAKMLVKASQVRSLSNASEVHSNITADDQRRNTHVGLSRTNWYNPDT